MNIRKVKNAAIWLYGSYARGSQDQYSDLDILIVSDHSVLLEKDDLPFSVTAEKLSLSSYSWTAFEKMASYGSLFLHHLHQEAKPIFESNGVKGKVSKILSRLCTYKRTMKDIEAFFQVIEDVEESIKYNCSYVYELSILGTVLRHSCILGCYIDDIQAFGRIDPVNTVVSEWDLDKAISNEFKDLYRFRLFSDRRNCGLPKANLEYLMLWCSRIKLVLKNLQERANVYERKMLAANFSS